MLPPLSEAPVLPPLLEARVLEGLHAVAAAGVAEALGGAEAWAGPLQSLLLRRRVYRVLMRPPAPAWLTRTTTWTGLQRKPLGLPRLSSALLCPTQPMPRCS